MVILDMSIVVPSATRDNTSSVVPVPVMIQLLPVASELSILKDVALPTIAIVSKFDIVNTLSLTSLLAVKDNVSIAGPPSRAKVPAPSYASITVSALLPPVIANISEAVDAVSLPLKPVAFRRAVLEAVKVRLSSPVTNTVPVAVAFKSAKVIVFTAARLSVTLTLSVSKSVKTVACVAWLEASSTLRTSPMFEAVASDEIVNNAPASAEIL